LLIIDVSLVGKVVNAFVTTIFPRIFLHTRGRFHQHTIEAFSLDEDEELFFHQQIGQMVNSFWQISEHKFSLNFVGAIEQLFFCQTLCAKVFLLCEQILAQLTQGGFYITKCNKVWQCEEGATSSQGLDIIDLFFTSL